MIELVAFLGNYGREYSRNRHNAGWMLADALPFALSWQRKFKGRYAALDAAHLAGLDAAHLAGLDAAHLARLGPAGLAGAGAAGGTTAPAAEVPQRLHFLMPETYMNLSGESVREAATFFKVPAERILVIHDELELPLGVASFKFSGGLGGHNGLRSMKACFGTADFWRLRLGIGRPDHPDIASWVLSDFTRDEAIALSLVLQAASAALVAALLRGPETLLPEWNKKRVTE